MSALPPTYRRCDETRAHYAHGYCPGGPDEFTFASGRFAGTPQESYLSTLEEVTEDEVVLATIAALRGELLDEDTCRAAAHVMRKAADRRHRHWRTAKALRVVADALEAAPTDDATRSGGQIGTMTDPYRGGAK